MSANTNPIFTLTPNIGFAKITTTTAQVKSDGTTAGTGTDLMFCVFASGANGSFIQRVRFNTVANAATSSVATVLRVYYSTAVTTVGSAAGATTSSNTTLLHEISVPIIASANSINATNYYEIPLNFAMPANAYIMVSQHVAQTTNQEWQATAFGGNY